MNSQTVPPLNLVQKRLHLFSNVLNPEHCSYNSKFQASPKKKSDSIQDESIQDESNQIQLNFENQSTSQQNSISDESIAISDSQDNLIQNLQKKKVNFFNFGRPSQNKTFNCIHFDEITGKETIVKQRIDRTLIIRFEDQPIDLCNKCVKQWLENKKKLLDAQKNLQKIQKEKEKQSLSDAKNTQIKPKRVYKSFICRGQKCLARNVNSPKLLRNHEHLSDTESSRCNTCYELENQSNVKLEILQEYSQFDPTYREKRRIQKDKNKQMKLENQEQEMSQLKQSQNYQYIQRLKNEVTNIVNDQSTLESTQNK